MGVIISAVDTRRHNNVKGTHFMNKGKQAHTQQSEVQQAEELFAELVSNHQTTAEDIKHQMLPIEFATKATNFQQIEEESVAGQNLIEALIEERIRQQVSQQELAIQMQTKQPALARLEQCNREPKISTLQKYAACLGKRISWQLVDGDDESVEQEQAYSPSFQRNL
jgi:ribosome-binding protein aMBF1 (putative translation factor)